MSCMSPLILALSCSLFSLTANGATLCPQGSEFRCMIDPCMVSECPGVPEATCQSNYCGGCNADFYINGVQLLSSDCQSGSALNKGSSVLEKRRPAKPKIPVFRTAPMAGNGLGRSQEQPPLLRPVDLINKPSPANGPRATLCAQGSEFRCMIDPCMVSECPGVPEATCQSNYCGGCNADFYINGVQLLSSDCQSGSALNKGSSVLEIRRPAKPKIPVFRTAPMAGNGLDLINKPSPANGPSELMDVVDVLTTRGDGKHFNRVLIPGNWRNQRGGARKGSEIRPRNMPSVPVGMLPSRFPQQSSDQQRSIPSSKPPRRPTSSRRQERRRRPSWFNNFARNLFKSYGRQ